MFEHVNSGNLLNALYKIGLVKYNNIQFIVV